jgi:hypothetical protein
MTKRFFYADPLAAAWMAKHFGMKFIDTFRNGPGTYSYPEESDDINAFFIGNTEYGVSSITDKHVVHPCSLPLLEPSIGDILRLFFFTPEEDDKAGAVMTGFYAGGREAITWFRDPKDGSIEKQLHKIDDHQWRIIHRRGIAFHHPESEEA